MQLSFQQVDVFTDEIFYGNPLAVFWTGAHHLSETLMQEVAREMNLSETIFVTEPPDAKKVYGVRIFTPDQELPFAGHPTIGGFYVLRSQGLVDNHGVQRSGAGETILAVDEQNVIWFNPPSGKVMEVSGSFERLAQVLRIDLSRISQNTPPAMAGTGLMQLMVPLKEDVVSEVNPDREQLSVLLKEWNANGVYVLAQTGPAEYHARFFGAGNGAVEDPATGSAAAAWGTYLLQTTGATSISRLKIRQGEEMLRPSTLWVRLNAQHPGSLEIGGNVVRVSSGILTIPKGVLSREPK